MLKTENLTIKFGGLTAVNNVNMHIKKGKITSLIGPNGAGKTTCFNLISGTYKPTSGKVIFLDQDITGLRSYKINEAGMSRTYQQINLFRTMTAEENVLVGMHPRLNHGNLSDAIIRPKKNRAEEKLAREKAAELMQFAGLLDKKDAICSSLPYGEQRKLEIIRAMASDPKLLLLDEPAAGMNTSEKVMLSNMILDIKAKGFTVLLVEHDMRLVMGISDYIYVLNYGTEIACGVAEEIQNNPTVIEAYLGGEE